VDAPLTGPVSYAVCAIMILSYVWGRFNTPPSNRSSTRRMLYWAGCTSYVLIALVLFAALSSLLQAAFWRKYLLGRAEDLPLPAPLIATLAMTTLLPTIPLLKHLDEWLLSLVFEWAKIPAEVKRVAAMMRERYFTVTEADLRSLERFFSEYNADTDMICLRGQADEGLELLQYRLTRVAKLYLEIQALTIIARYSRLFNETVAEYNELQRKAMDFVLLSNASLSTSVRLRALHDGADRPPSVADRRADDQLWERVYDELTRDRFITFARSCDDIFEAQALFLGPCCDRSRAKRLSSAGCGTSGSRYRANKRHSKRARPAPKARSV
jgi:hypothetical protein